MLWMGSRRSDREWTRGLVDQSVELMSGMSIDKKFDSWLTTVPIGVFWSFVIARP